MVSRLADSYENVRGKSFHDLTQEDVDEVNLKKYEKRLLPLASWFQAICEEYEKVHQRECLSLRNRIIAYQNWGNEDFLKFIRKKSKLEIFPLFIMTAAYYYQRTATPIPLCDQSDWAMYKKSRDLCDAMDDLEYAIEKKPGETPSQSLKIFGRAFGVFVDELIKTPEWNSQPESDDDVILDD